MPAPVLDRHAAVVLRRTGVSHIAVKGTGIDLKLSAAHPGATADVDPGGNWAKDGPHGDPVAHSGEVYIRIKVRHVGLHPFAGDAFDNISITVTNEDGTSATRVYEVVATDV